MPEWNVQVELVLDPTRVIGYRLSPSTRKDVVDELTQYRTVDPSHIGTASPFENKSWVENPIATAAIIPYRELYADVSAGCARRIARRAVRV
jgi:hypothetical protein